MNKHRSRCLIETARFIPKGAKSEWGWEWVETATSAHSLAPLPNKHGGFTRGAGHRRYRQPPRLQRSALRPGEWVKWRVDLVGAGSAGPLLRH
jgi:hypothetical protein